MSKTNTIAPSRTPWVIVDGRVIRPCPVLELVLPAVRPGETVTIRPAGIR